MFAHLPPVGNPIATRSEEDAMAVLDVTFATFDAYAYRSGTMALAASLLVAVSIAREEGLKGTPEVLLPAYACPDLISAAVCAGVRPILVDFVADRPWMCLDSLGAKLNAQTVAVIAVHFLGIPERLDGIREVLSASKALLIEDSAQYFPCGELQSSYWSGDLVVLSFGRGKPVSLLGGGAVLCRKEGRQDQAQMISALAQTSQCMLSDDSPGLPPLMAKQRIKVALYNALLSPSLYGLLQCMPFLSIGETHYHPLESIQGVKRGFGRFLAANMVQYQGRSRKQQDWVASIISGQRGNFAITDLPVNSLSAPAEPLLRYPILLPNEGIKKRLLQNLNAAGIGASGMYPVILPQIAGITDMLADQGVFPHAKRFAACVLTLPTHQGLTRRHCERMTKAFKDVM